eukprot:6459947-Amphidinium_carterae.1
MSGRPGGTGPQGLQNCPSHALVETRDLYGSWRQLRPCMRPFAVAHKGGPAELALRVLPDLPRAWLDRCQQCLAASSPPDHAQRLLPQESGRSGQDQM